MYKNKTIFKTQIYALPKQFSENCLLFELNKLEISFEEFRRQRLQKVKVKMFDWRDKENGLQSKDGES